MVTHDHREAFTLADSIGVMSKGKLLQWGEAAALYKQPNSAYVASFVNAGNVVAGQIINKKVSTKAGVLDILLDNNLPMPSDGTAVQILIPDEDVLVDPAGELRAHIVSKTFHGARMKLKLALSSNESSNEHIHCFIDSDCLLYTSDAADE